MGRATRSPRRFLTVAHAMTLLVAIVAFDRRGRLLEPLLGATLGDVAHFAAILALGDAASHNLSRIRQSLIILLGRRRPELTLTGSRRLGFKTIVDSERLSQVTLEIHVSKGHGQARPLHGDEVGSNTLGTKSLLKINIGGVGRRFDVGLHGKFEVVDFALSNSLFDHLPCFLRGSVREGRSIH